MKTIIKTGLLGLTFASVILSSCTSGETAKADYQVVPMPLEISAVQQSSFLLKNGVNIYYTPGNEMMKRNAEFLASYIKEQTGIELKAQEGEGKSGGISLQLGLDNENPEAYQLKVTGDYVVISAPTEAGVFYGIQTLRKSVSVNKASAIELPAIDIVDKPRFSYRGMMLDVGRHFFTMDELKTYIDILALHNINRFHWHLSEDQGWRIEIKKYKGNCGLCCKEIYHSNSGN